MAGFSSEAVENNYKHIVFPTWLADTSHKLVLFLAYTDPKVHVPVKESVSLPLDDPCRIHENMETGLFLYYSVELVSRTVIFSTVM